MRNGKEKKLHVRIGKRPEDLNELKSPGQKEFIFRGIAVGDFNVGLKKGGGADKKEGVVIIHIEDGSPADSAGLNTGDIILKVEGKIIKNKKDFILAVSKVKGSCLIKTNRGYFVIKEK